MSDLSLYTDEELEQVIAQARSQQRELGLVQRVRLRDTLLGMIEEEGLHPSEVFPEHFPSSEAEKDAKYRHPHHPCLAWDGNGDPPRWYLDVLAYGYPKERMLTQVQRSQAPVAPAKRLPKGYQTTNTGLFKGVASLKHKVMAKIQRV